MKPRSAHQFGTTLIATLLIVTLAACGGPAPVPTPAPAATQMPMPAATQAPAATRAPAPTAAPAATSAPAIPLGAEQRVEAGGFAFQPAQDYAVDTQTTIVFLLAPGGDPVAGPAAMLAARTIEDGTSLDDANASVAAEFTSPDVEFSKPQAVTVDGAPALATDLNGVDQEQDLAARLIVAMPAPGRLFLMFGVAPAGQWAGFAPYFDAMLQSVTFFEPVASGGSTGGDPGTEPIPDLPLGWTVYSNGNEIRGLAVSGNALYAAGLGGVVLWDLKSGQGIKYNTRDGLTHISTRDAVYCEMPEARIVVATDAGITLFDPATRRPEPLIVDVPNFPNTAAVTRLFCDGENGRLILGSGGLGVYDFNSGDWHRFTDKDGLTWNDVRGVAVRGEEIWVASGYNGVSVVSGGRVSATYDESKGLPDNRVHSLAVGDDGETLWMGTTKGLVKFDGAWTLYDPATVAGMPRGGLYRLALAPGGSLWAGGETGALCRFDPATTTCAETYQDPDHRAIMALIVDDGGTAYYATNLGAYYRSGDTWKELVRDELLVSNYVSAVAEDAGGMLWIGAAGGLQRLDPADPNAPWQTYRKGDGPAEGQAVGIARGPDGALWFAMQNGPATRYANGEWATNKDLRSARAVAVDALGRGWFGTNDGVAIWDGTSVTMLADGLPAKRVNALLRDGDAMWIGTDQGLARWQDGTVETVLAKNAPGLKGSVILAIYRGDDGALLLGTSGGLSAYDGTAATLLVESRYWVMGIVQDKTGRVWAGTQGGGLLYSDGDAWESFTTLDGLTTNFIRALYTDRFGTVWIGGGDTTGGGGLARYVP